MSEALLRTPLYDLHVELGARLVPFAGYSMPLQYTEGLRAEHLWTRAQAGLFDVSHMGQLRIRGAGLFEALEQALPVDFDRWDAGVQKYSLLLNDRGGIEDDVMVARLDGEVALVANAARKAADRQRLKALCPQLEFQVLENALLALQGPLAEAVLPEAAGLKFMQVRRMLIGDMECLVTRSGYTGEDGFEISVAADDAVKLARKLLGHPAVKPIGLGARDTLRLEAGLPLYGQDIDAATTPREAGLAWAIAPARRKDGAKALGYPGAPHVERMERRLVGLIGLSAVPVRAGADLVNASGESVGKVTSGTVSPSLGKPVMLGYVAPEVPDQARLSAVVRERPQPVQIVPTPFVPKRYKR